MEVLKLQEPQTTPSARSSLPPPPPFSSLELDVLTADAVGLSNMEVKPPFSKTTMKSRFGEGKFNVCPPSPSAVSIGCRPLGAKIIKNSLANADPLLVIRVVGRHLTPRQVRAIGARLVSFEERS